MAPTTFEARELEKLDWRSTFSAFDALRGDPFEEDADEDGEAITSDYAEAIRHLAEARDEHPEPRPEEREADLPLEPTEPEEDEISFPALA